MKGVLGHFRSVVSGDRRSPSPTAFFMYDLGAGTHVLMALVQCINVQSIGCCRRGIFVTWAISYRYRSVVV